MCHFYDCTDCTMLFCSTIALKTGGCAIYHHGLTKKNAKLFVIMY